MQTNTNDPKDPKDRKPASALSLTKELYERLFNKEEIPYPELQKHLRTLNKLFSEQDCALKKARRELADEKSRHVAELDTLRSEVHCELVDREANAARITERQRFLFERTCAQPGQSAANDRAFASAAYVEAAMVALCPHPAPPSSGCDQLASAVV